jgi:hypothetical protein
MHIFTSDWAQTEMETSKLEISVSPHLTLLPLPLQKCLTGQSAQRILKISRSTLELGCTLHQCACALIYITLSNLGFQEVIGSGPYRSHDHTKADMYSLGIVFFEMNFSFNTQSERITVLENLRKLEIIFPSTWQGRLRQKQSGLSSSEIYFLIYHVCSHYISPPARR